MDVTDFCAFHREKGIKFYTAFICAVSRIVNADEHFKMGLDSEGCPVVYDEVSPCYTDFIPELEGFSTMVTDYCHNAKEFCRRITADRELHAGRPSAAPDRMIDNMFSITALPWVNYSALNIHYYNEWSGLAPIIAWGKYSVREGRSMLPVTL